MFVTRCCRHLRLFRHPEARSDICRIFEEHRSVSFQALQYETGFRPASFCELLTNRTFFKSGDA